MGERERERVKKEDARRKVKRKVGVIEKELNHFLRPETRSPFFIIFLLFLLFLSSSPNVSLFPYSYLKVHRNAETGMVGSSFNVQTKDRTCGNSFDPFKRFRKNL